jgi:acyl dehydratase
MTASIDVRPAIRVGGPFFEDLEVGDRLDDAPSVTVTDGLAAAHQAIVGDRLRLPLDRGLTRDVVGADTPLAHPALVCDVAIGQSTQLTQRVIANLFYRGLVFARTPLIGDTLTTTTEVVALRQNRPKPGRAATGLAALRIRTVDQERRPVLDFWRCAMLPLRDPAGVTGRDDDLEGIPADLDLDVARSAVAAWDLSRVERRAAGELELGTRWVVEGGDVVSSAPDLARLSLNVATAHHDATSSGARLVYGGHTIGIAAAQATRALPELLTIVAWHGCDHVGPVFEGDTLVSEIELEHVDDLERGGRLVHLRSRVDACRAADRVRVLDWRFVAVLA